MKGVLLNTRYKPKVIKDLLPSQKKLYEEIKTWLSDVKRNYKNSQIAKRILCIYGNAGVGKTCVSEISLKNYDVFAISSDDIRKDKETDELISGIPSYLQNTFKNTSWNVHELDSCKKNIVLIDNVEFCEKNIYNFLKNLHCSLDKNIPVILITNNIRFVDNFYTAYKNELDISKFTLQIPNSDDFFSLFKRIQKVETDLNLSKDDIDIIFQVGNGNIYFLFHILHQYTLLLSSNYRGKIDIESFVKKHITQNQQISPEDRLKKILYSDDKEITEGLEIEFSDCINMSNLIYTNCLEISQDTQTCYEILDILSRNSSISKSIFDEQKWELYDYNCNNSCIYPASILKQYLQHDVIKEFYKNDYQFKQHKEPSLNYYNSLIDLEKKSNNNSDINTNFFRHRNIKNYFTVGKMYSELIVDINKFFDKSKRGKNTFRKEKLKLYNLLTSDDDNTEILQKFTRLIEFCYINSLYELDNSLNINPDISDSELENYLNKIHIKLLRRFINISTLENTQTLIKSNTELAIKYELLKKIRDTSSKNLARTDVNSLVTNLSDIWNI